MTDIAIRVENLGKRYRIGGKQERYKTLRDSLVQTASAPVRAAGSLLRRGGHHDGAPEEIIWALKDVSFEVKRGEVVGIIGRNGAGKSTLLKILTRITDPTEGRAVIRGRVASLLEVGTGFHPELTGRENLYLSGAILGMTRAEIERKFDEIVDFSGVEKFIDTPVKRYSSGMQVRLAFSVAAHLEPEILLVDEVLAVGDAAFQKKCLGKMEGVAKEGRTVLFVSHNMTAIMALCSRCLLIDAGQIANSGRSPDVVQSYLEMFQSMSSERDLRLRQDRRGDGSLRVVGLRFGTSGNHECGFWVTGENSFAEVSYQGSHNKVYRNLEIALGIRKLDQSHLLYLGTKVVHQDVEFVRDLGVSVCTIERLPLEPDTYSVSVEIKQNGIIVDHVESAATVDVADGDYYGTGIIWPYGGLLCDYSWSHSEGSQDALDW